MADVPSAGSSGNSGGADTLGSAGAATAPSGAGAAGSANDGARRRLSREKIDRIFGESLSSLSRDECGDRAEGQAERRRWEGWLREQKPPHYDY